MDNKPAKENIIKVLCAFYSCRASTATSFKSFDNLLCAALLRQELTARAKSICDVYLGKGCSTPCRQLRSEEEPTTGAASLCGR